MKRRIEALATAAAIATIALGGSALAADTKTKLITTIDIPGEELKLFDIGVVDPAAGRYYIADRSNKAVDIFDTRKRTFVGRIAGFVGVSMQDGRPVGNMSGPNGTALDPLKKELWVGDGDSTLKVIDLKAKEPKIVDSISTGGQKRADELSVDAKDGIVLVINDNDRPAFGTFVSTKPGHKILGKLEFPDATNGVEQSQYVAQTGLFYISIPAWKGDRNMGGVGVIDPKTMKLLRMSMFEGCSPSGLSQGPGTHLLVGCGAGSAASKMDPATVIWDFKTEKVVKVVKDVGGMDEVWYDSSTNRYYTASGNNGSGPVLGVIDAKTNSWIENVPTAVGAHSVAADSKAKVVLVPLPANPACPKSCIGVYGEAK
jgi:DNA-binding beta-propeller fold protein YncE